MSKDERWFLHIRWHKCCIECQNRQRNICTSRSCASLAYDEWGHYLPASLICPDHDGTPEYLEKKRIEMQNSNYHIENIIGERVMHSRYGIGIVTAQSESTFTVSFPSIDAEKRFIYPDALCTYIRLVDNSVP